MTAVANPNHSAFRYMDRFHCIGSECEDSCCRGWEIHLDQAHYKRLKEAMDGDPQTRQEFGESVRRVKDSTRSRGKFALHVLDQNGACNLLRGDGLCSVHARWGESLLSDTCAVYPRAMAHSGARFELAGSVSCPEVARQVLLHDDALELVPSTPAAFVRPLLMQELGDHPAKPYHRYHDELRNLFVDLLGDSRFPLVSRLGFISYFAHRVGAFLDDTTTTLDDAHLAVEIERIVGLPLREDLDRRFREIKPEATFPGQLVVALLAARASKVGADGFRRLVEAALAHYAGEGEHDAAVAARGYATAKDAWASDVAFSDRLLANYAKHYWVREWYYRSPSLLAHQIQLLVRLAVIRFVAFGHPLLAGAKDASPEMRRSLLERALVDTVQKFSRNFEHDSAFSRLLQQDLAAASMISFAHATCIAVF